MSSVLPPNIRRSRTSFSRLVSVDKTVSWAVVFRSADVSSPRTGVRSGGGIHVSPRNTPRTTDTRCSAGSILWHPSRDANPHGINHLVDILADRDDDDPQVRILGEELTREPYPVVPVQVDLEQYHVDLMLS